MKILNTSSDFFYSNLAEIVQKRSQNNLPSVDESVKKIINGFEVDNKESLVNPESLEFYKDIKELHI